MDMTKHAEEVKELWEDYGRKQNRRVPIVFASDEQLWLKLSGGSFREFYLNPKVQLQTQLDGLRWVCENVVGDMAPGLPERWVVGPREWMSENQFFGCETVYQENDYAWALPLAMDRDSLLSHIADLDPEEQVRKSNVYRTYQTLKELADGMEYCGRPVSVFGWGASHGIFTKAAEIRGLGQICLDLLEAPDFVDELLRLVTEKTIARIKAWEKITTGSDEAFPVATGYGMADDSLQMLSAAQYGRFVLPCHERYYSALTTGRRSMHLCGRASQHYETLRWKLNITALDGPGTFVDHGKYLQDFGPEFSLVAQTDHSVLSYGSTDDIEQMMRKLLSPEAKAPGRFHIMGFIHRDTPLDKVNACYQAVRNSGQISDT